MASALGDDQGYPVFAGHPIFCAFPRDSGICWLPFCICLLGSADHLSR